MKKVASALGVTLNDIVLAMCSSALRTYMIENNSMPDDPLIAMVPVSMHVGADDDGNAVSAVMANLATDDPDPASRLKTLVDSMRASKNVIRGLRPIQALALEPRRSPAGVHEHPRLRQLHATAVQPDHLQRPAPGPDVLNGQSSTGATWCRS